MSGNRGFHNQQKAVRRNQKRQTKQGRRMETEQQERRQEQIKWWNLSPREKNEYWAWAEIRKQRAHRLFNLHDGGETTELRHYPMSEEDVEKELKHIKGRNT